MLRHIGYVLLGISEMGRAVAFYRDRLGLAVKADHPGFIFLETGPVTLCLSQPLAQVHGVLPGAVEVVFPVEHVRAAHEALKAKGVEFTHEPHNVTGPMWAANFDDPDGHHLSVFGPE